MPRKKLPNRRPCLTETLEIEGRKYAVSYGFDPNDAELREIFISARGKSGSNQDHELYSAGVLASHALQNGADAMSLARSLQSAGGHHSVIGAALSQAPKL